MNKISEFYYYVFFRLSEFRNNNISGTNTAYSTILLMSLVLFLYVGIFILVLSEIFKIQGLFDMLNSNVSNKLLIPVCCLLFNLYFFKGRSKNKIIKQFEDGGTYKSKQNDFLTILYLIFPFAISAFFILLGIFGWLK